MANALPLLHVEDGLHVVNSMQPNKSSIEVLENAESLVGLNAELDHLRSKEWKDRLTMVLLSLSTRGDVAAAGFVQAQPQQLPQISLIRAV